MVRACVVFALFCALGMAALGANVTVTIDGKAVAVPVIEANGKAFVDVKALMTALGGKASYDAASHKVTVTSPAATSSAGSAGTAQLAGDNGEFGKLYTLCPKNPIYFNLQRAEYTTSQVVIGDRLFTPKADEKLLVLHFTVQNPQKNERLVRYDSLRFMAVDAMNVNHEYAREWGDAESKQRLSMLLKPAQKIAGYTVIAVPAKGVIPKLMILPQGDDGPVLRYDLRGKVTALPAFVADPADESGATARESVPAVMKTAYPCEGFDVTVEKFAYTTEPLDQRPPIKDGRYLVVSLLLKNKAPVDRHLRYDMLTPTLTSTDGEILKYQNMLFATTDRRIDQQLKPDQEMRVRLFFTIPKGVTAQTLSLKERNSREYLFEVKEE